MQDVILPQPFLKPFPDPRTAFADPVARYERRLNALVSIDLSAVSQDLSGWIHLVSPIEPYDGLLGLDTTEYWGPYLQQNWIGFRLTPEHRYELLGDFRFFQIEDEVSQANLLQEYSLEKHYHDQHASFAEKKAQYLATGQIGKIPQRGGSSPMPALSYLGGEAPAINLVWSNVPGAAFTYSDADKAPRTADGRLYRFIAAVPGWHYRSAGADAILLYYDPVERVALETFVFA